MIAAQYDCFTSPDQNVSRSKAAGKTALGREMGQQTTTLSKFTAVESSRDDDSSSDPVAMAVARARAQWERDENERLLDVESAWKAKAEKRLAISRIGAQRAESAMQQMQRRLQKVEHELAARISEVARLKYEAEQARVLWAQSPAAAQAQKAARDLQFERRMKIAVRLTRDFAWGVLVVALAVLAAERAVPVATGVWKHETGSRSVIKPLLRQAGIDTDYLPHAVVVAPVARLRSHPSSAARQTALLAKGTRVTLLGRRGRWLLVSNADATEQGWVQLSTLENSTP
jgi:hypothetical protein